MLTRGGRLFGVSLDPLLRMPVIDDGLHAAVTPLGQSLRVAGTADFCGWNDTLDLTHRSDRTFCL